MDGKLFTYDDEQVNEEVPVTCLGITFENDTKRREYFREELRKKLPELRLIEGFPIGEDDDIIALSDPPYYTACPNPWINDFIKEWEAEHGQIPENAFVAFKSDWSKRPDSELDNVDAEGNKHYPGWSVDAVDFLVEERNVRAIGHETSDTDPAVVAASEGFLAEIAILKHDRYQVELMINLSEVPPTGGIIFVMAPKVKEGPGFPVRCIAVCPK